MIKIQREILETEKERLKLEQENSKKQHETQQAILKTQEDILRLLACRVVWDRTLNGKLSRNRRVGATVELGVDTPYGIFSPKKMWNKIAEDHKWKESQ